MCIFYIRKYMSVVLVIIIIETWNIRRGYKSDRAQINQWINPRVSIVYNILLLLRLGGSNWQPRTDFLRGPREQDNNMAATHSSPSPTDSPEVQFHPADGTAESPVRVPWCSWVWCVCKAACTIARLSVEWGHSCSHSWPHVVIFMWLLLLVCMWASRTSVFHLCS